MLTLDLTHAPKLPASEKKKLIAAKTGIQKKYHAGNLGFIDLPHDTDLPRCIERFTAENKHVNDVVLLGIGGSALGAKAIRDALPHPTKTLHILDTLDPDVVIPTITKLNPQKTCLLAISKSGNTLEPMVLLDMLREIKYANTAVITEEESMLWTTAKQKKWTTFAMPQNVGGRFSVLSAVGMVPAALIGADVKKILKGARETDARISAFLALLQYHMDIRKKCPITVLFPYAHTLGSFTDWCIQLIAESLGKNKKGPTPLKAIGPTDQHAQLQLFMEGPQNKWYLFFTVEEHLHKDKSPHNTTLTQILNTQQKATAQALAETGQYAAALTCTKVDEETLGALFFTMEMMVALCGELYHINAFNQPGVERGKIITQELLSFE